MRMEHWKRAITGIIFLGLGLFLAHGEGVEWKGGEGDMGKLKLDVIIDFGDGMPASQDDIFTNVGKREVRDGRLYLVLGEGSTGNYFYVPNAGAIKAEDYRGVEVRLMVKTKEAEAARKDGLRFIWTSLDGEEYELKQELKDAAGEFHTYNFSFEGVKNWGGAIKEIKIPLDFGQKNAGGTEVAIEQVRFLVSREDELNNKTLQAMFRMFYLGGIEDGLRKDGIEVKGLREDIEKFLDRAKKAEEAKRRYFKDKKTDDLEEGLKLINEAEAILRETYPRIEAARKLAGIKDGITGLKEVSELYSRRGAEKGEVSSEGLMEKWTALARSALARSRQSILTKEWSALAGKLKRGQYGIGEGISGIGRGVRKGNEGLDKISPYGLPMRLGLSQSSFGRFGWSTVKFGEGLLVYNVEGNNFTKEHGKFTVSALPGRKRLISQEKTDVNWVSFRKKYVYVDEGGKNIKWDLYCSLLAPGVLIDTDSDEIMLFAGGSKGAPDKVALMGEKGARVTELKEGENKLNMPENWMLLLWDKTGGKKSSAALLVFERKPEKIGQDETHVSFFRKDGMGHVGVVDYAGVMPFAKEEIGKWEKEGVPEAVAEKCRRIAEMMGSYPVRCREYFGVDDEKRQVLIRNEFEYLTVTNEWGKTGREYAPVPPLLCFVKENGYPVEVKDKLVDFGVATKYGPYRAAEGNAVEYRIPIPDFHHRTYLNTHALDARLPPAFSTTYRGKKSIFKTGSYMLSDVSSLPGWNMFSPAVREGMIGETGYRLDFLFNRLPDALGTLENSGLGLYYKADWPFLDRVEPFTGKQYLQGGSIWYRDGGVGCMMTMFGFEGLGDGPNLHGYFLQDLYYYARYSGNWGYIQKHWPAAKRLFECYQRQNDWANFAIPYYESEADTHTDMGPDCLKGNVAMMDLARAIGDEEQYRWATYISAKTAMALLAQFPMAEYFKKYHGEPLPERPVCWEFGLSEWGLPISCKGCSSIYSMTPKYKAYIDNLPSGCWAVPEILDLRSQYLTAPYRNFFYQVYPKYFPGIFLNASGNKIMLARGYLANSFKEKQEFADYFRKNCEPVIPFGHVRSLYNLAPLLSLVQGLGTPCYLVNWDPNRLVSGEYDLKANRANIELEASVAGRVELKSLMEPVSVSDNGKIMEKTGWRYNQERQVLTIGIKEETRKIVIDYTGWKNEVAWQ